MVEKIKETRPVDLAAKASAEIRALKAEANETELMYIIEKSPGLSSYELAKKLNWSGGKVRHYLLKLFKDNEIVMKETHNRARLKKEVYAVDWKEMIDWSKIKKIGKK